MANSVDPDRTPRSAASHMGLHCKISSFCLIAWGKCGSCMRKAKTQTSLHINFMIWSFLIALMIPRYPADSTGIIARKAKFNGHHSRILVNTLNRLTLSTLGKFFSRRHIEIFFLFFPENMT